MVFFWYTFHTVLHIQLCFDVEGLNIEMGGAKNEVGAQPLISPHFINHTVQGLIPLQLAHITYIHSIPHPTIRIKIQN